MALELPEGLTGELDWAASCWPGPVVSASQTALFPFVPGDSIFEAFRAARAAGVPVVLVDLAAACPAEVSSGDVKMHGFLAPNWRVTKPGCSGCY